MSIIDSSLIETHYYQRTIEFDGRDPEPYISYAHKGKQWIPDMANARWNHGEPIKRISVTGYLLKKDGTPSQIRGEISYDTPAHRSWGTRFAKAAPEWLLELVKDSPNTA